MENSIERGEVYFIHLDPAFGREIGGYKPRPVVVISTNDIHQKTRIVMVVPGTSSESNFPNFVRVDNRNVLREITYFACHQIRAVDQGRMTSRATGRLSREEMRKIESTVSRTLGLGPSI